MAKEVHIIRRSEALLLSQTPEIIIKNLAKRINTHITGLSTEELSSTIFIPTGYTKMRPEVKKGIKKLLSDAGWQPAIKDADPDKEIYITLKAPPTNKPK